jgi:hypothetical protein
MGTFDPVVLLKQGVPAWNAWRRSVGVKRPNLVGADLRNRNLRGVDLRGAQLVHTRLSNAKLDGADLRHADLRAASLREASLRDVQFQHAILRHANLSGADISGANFDDSQIYGAGLWQLEGQPASTQRMRVCRSRAAKPPPGEPVLLADSLDAAQFMFLLLDNPRITEAFDALNRRIVLILGRFAPPHRERLKMIKRRLTAGGHYLPIVFDFEAPAGRSLTESIAGFAHLSLFVVADLTDPRSVPQELSHIVPFLPSVPVLPLVPRRDEVYSMFEHFLRFPWVLEPVEYGDATQLEAIFGERVLAPAVEAAARLREQAARLRERG